MVNDMRNISLLFFWFLLFLYSSDVASSEINIEAVLKKKIYKHKQNEIHLVRSVARIFNKHTAARGTAFFVKHNQKLRLVTNFHIVCCFRGPVGEALFISTSDQNTTPISNIVHLDPYNDLAVLEVEGVFSDYFLELNGDRFLQKEDKVRVFGYISDYSDVIRLKGKVIENGPYFDTGVLNFYQLSGMSGSPVFREGDDFVGGIIIESADNVGLITPVSKINKLMTKEKACVDGESCQFIAVSSLLARANHGDPHAQFVLGILLNKGFGSYLAYYVEELGQDIGLNRLLWWFLSADFKHTQAMLNFGVLLVGDNERDTEAGLQWVLKAAKKNDIPANYVVGSLFLLSDEENASSKAEEHLTVAAFSGHVLAQAKLGKFYRKKYEESNNEDEKKNYKEKSLFWNRKAAKENHYPPAAREILEILAN